MELRGLGKAERRGSYPICAGDTPEKHSLRAGFAPVGPKTRIRPVQEHACGQVEMTAGDCACGSDSSPRKTLSFLDEVALTLPESWREFKNKSVVQMEDKASRLDLDRLRLAIYFAVGFKFR
jgi:hypothetical protein